MTEQFNMMEQLPISDRKTVDKTIKAIDKANGGCRWTVQRERMGQTLIAEVFRADGNPIFELEWMGRSMSPVINDLRPKGSK